MSEEIGPYSVEASIGQGGMGEVYRGYDGRLDRPVALKRIKVEAEDSEPARERFKREARALARVRHPAVVEVYDWVERDNGDWIVMEFLEGRSLASLVEEGPLEMRRAVEIARDIADGLAAVHAHGIVHRDLKPDNIMLVPPGLESTAPLRASAGRVSADQVKILDFGLAKRVTSMDGVTLTETISKEGQILGTVRFMSPEQASGRSVDPRSDLFSLGVLLYEMLTGVPPFGGDNAVETLTRICTEAETPVHQLDPAVPESVSEMVRRMLRKEPERRPQNAAEVAEALDGLVDGLAAGRSDAELRAALPASGSDRNMTSVTQIAEEATVDNLTSALAETASLSGTHVRTLLLSDLVDSTKLVEKVGDERAARTFEQHDRMARTLLKQNDGREIDKSNGFLMLFERPIDAVRFALGYHAALEEISEQEGVVVSSRVGIHVGEVVLRVNSAEDVARGAKPLEVEGLAKAMAARFMRLAGARQTLISRGVIDLARRAAVGAADLPEGLRWMEHGRYRMKGVEEPVEVFEVGVEGTSPRPPRDTEKVKRVEEEKGGFLTRRRLLAIAAALLVFVAGSSLFWWWRKPASLEIAVLAPEVTAPDSSVEAALVAGAVRGALMGSLASLEGVSVSPRDQVDGAQGTSLEVARALAADEVVAAQLECSARMCQITLSRVLAESGDAAWAATFSSRADDLLVLHNAVTQNLRRGYTERRVKSGTADLEVRAQDYATYLRLLHAREEKDSELTEEEILRQIQELQTTSPRFLDAYLLEAAIASGLHYDTREEKYLEIALKANRAACALAPEDPLALLRLAMTARNAELLEVWEDAVDELDEVAIGNPNVLASRALLLEKKGQTEEALAKMHEAVELLPSWEMLRELAMMEYRYGAIDQAREHLERALDLNPGRFMMSSQLAQLELFNGDPERAVELYEALVEQKPEVGNLVNLGVAYLLVEKYSDAVGAFQRATDKAPGQPFLLLNLADAELLLNREAEATMHYRQVLAILEEDPVGETWQGKSVRAQALAHLGEIEAAVAMAQEASQLAPDNPQVALEVAMVYALAGERTSAIVHVDRAIAGGTAPRWFRFPWFDSLKENARFQELVGVKAEP